MTELKEKRAAGYAVIKSEYLLPYKQCETIATVDTQDSKGDTATDPQKGIIATNAEDSKNNDKAPEKQEDVADQNNGGNNLEDSLNKSSEEPPSKKKKKGGGQNKARPRTVPRVGRESRICPRILHNETCRFGDKCCFLHDINKYIENRPADIGDVCVNFELKGKCQFGVECRFSKKHLKENYENIVDEQKFKIYSETVKYDRTISKDSLFLLRKKKYEFPKSDQYFKSLQNKTEQQPQYVKSLENKAELHTPAGAITNEDVIALKPNEKKKIDFSNKLYLAPLTTVGNLPFRRVCKKLGADITCGEMAMSTQLLQQRQSEWALLKRHESEDLFGVQLCGGYPDTMTKTAEMLNKECEIDFIDINLGCPIDLVFKKGEGSALMGRMNKLQTIVQGMVQVSDVPITIKMRTGIFEGKSIAHKVVPLVKEWGVSAITLHGRSREQRYTRDADWEYIDECSQLANPVPFFGNGDILSYEDVNLRRETTNVNGVMIARGALMKPWLFTEIKEQRHWDISSSERFNLLKDYTNYGLEHWGSDSRGVESTRRFLLEWLSFLHRYIPVGILEVVPQKINEKPSPHRGRDDLETLFASRNANDWVKISEMLLGPVPDNFIFVPKHKANSYA